MVRDFGYRAFTACGRPFQAVPLSHSSSTSESRNPGRQARRFGLLRVRSPLLAESLLLSFPPGTEMFHFPGCRARGLWIHPASTGIAASGLPHSETHGSKRVGRSPWLFAASRVLRRLAMPRHPPHARQRLSGNRLHPEGAGFPARRSLRHSSGSFGCQRSQRGTGRRPLLEIGRFSNWPIGQSANRRIGRSPSALADGGRDWSRTSDLVLIRDAL